MSVLAPLSSKWEVRTTQSSDLVAHVGAIVQAKMALDEGQFPPKVGPYFQNNFGNAIFQFYAPLYFIITGSMYKFLFSDNPYSALKFFIFLSLCFAGIFFYKLIYFFTKSESISFVSAFTYLINPYLLVNLYGIVHVPELIAQCILTSVLYYSVKIYFCAESNVQNIIFAAISWFALLCIHPITFVYLSCSLSLFLTIITLFEVERFTKLLTVGVSYLYGILLSSFYFFPVLLFTKNSVMNEHNLFIYPPHATFFTPLSTLLSIYPSAQMPLPGNGWLTPETRFYFSIGLPVILGIFGMVFLFYKRYPFPNRTFKIVSGSLLCVCCVIFIAAWTPFYFWNFLPRIFQIGQFTYRFLVQMSWAGTMMFAMTLFVFVRNRSNAKYTILCFMLIFLSLKPWLETKPTSKNISVQSIIENPSVPDAKDSYLMLGSKMSSMRHDVTMPVSHTEKDCAHVKKYTVCNISLPSETNNLVQLPIYYYPDMLNIKVNGQKISYVATPYSQFALVGLELPRGTYKIESYFQGLPWANWISVLMWILTVIGLCKNFVAFRLQSTFSQ